MAQSCYQMPLYDGLVAVEITCRAVGPNIVALQPVLKMLLGKEGSRLPWQWRV